MKASIERQRASIQRQAAASVQNKTAPGLQKSTGATPPLGSVPGPEIPKAGFFSSPWPNPTPLAQVFVPIQADCDPLPKDQLDPLVAGASTREGVDAALVQAVIERESAAKPCAVSPKGAQGLMQLMPAVVSDFGVKDPFDARQNIDGGTRLLKQLLTKYGGDVSLALGAYNAGSARVDSAGGIPPIPETINYVNDILAKTPDK